MPEFSYQALNDADEVTSGHVSAENVAAAIRQIEVLGVRVTSIQQVDAKMQATAEPSDGSGSSQKPVSEDQQVLRGKIAELIEKREILVPALAAFAAEFPRGRSRRQLRQLVSQLRTGATAEEISQSRRQTTAWLPLLAGGSDSHQLLSELFTEASRESENRGQWFRTMLYPLVVIFVALAVLIFLCIAVVPTFSSIFHDFGMTLPDLTRWLLYLSDILMRSPVVFGLTILATVAAAYVLTRLAGAWGLPGRLLNALTVGNSRQLTAMARFTHRVAEALSANTGLPAALRFAGNSEGWGSTRRIAIQLASDAEQDAFDLKKSPSARRLPATVVHALQAGPSGNPSIPLLRQLAEVYTTRVRDRCDLATGFMAQLAIFGLGFTVLFVVLALFLPLLDLVSNLSG